MRRAVSHLWAFVAVLGLCARGVAVTHAHEGGDGHHVHGPAAAAPARHQHGHGPGGCGGHGHAGHDHPGHRHGPGHRNDPGHRHAPPVPEAPPAEGEHTHVMGLDAAARAASPVAAPGAGDLLRVDGPPDLVWGAALGGGYHHRPVLPGPGTGPPTALVADDLLAHLLSQGSGLLL